MLFTICIFAIIGAALAPSRWAIAMATADVMPPAPEFQQMMGMLQQVVQEQIQQRAHLDTLQQAIGNTAQGVGLTQQLQKV